ncbi:S-layer protein [Cetobacterium sp. 2A]|uniref:LptA/OstA family protein n=1 Tax=Cetobacterium sp. 2A TaxID=2754723 RepID=UPI00163B9D17|nr:LptA/OstA family protein [Cetobacterium sp. 2A]MBC2855902.1 S-layer protein [Cetobacterium sp. 2A]
MNRKKLLYIGAVIVVLALGYLNYFGDEKEIKPKEQIIETTDVIYDSEGYHIEAQKQKDIVKTDETTFESAKALVKDMIISGDNVLLDAAKNLVLKTNILGKSMNGWEFKTDSAKYVKELDQVVSDSGVVAINKEKNIEISGKNFKTDTKMSYVDVTEGVVLKSGNYILKSDSANYSDKSKEVNLSGNITIEGKELGEEKGTLSGQFSNGKYNIETKILEAFGPFNLDYNNIKLFGEKFWFDENTGAFKITENVYILADGYKIDVKEISRKSAQDSIEFTGKVSGTNGVYSFVADNGIYDTKNKTLDMIGNIFGKSKEGQELVAQLVKYNRESGILQLFGGKEDVVYTQKDESIKSKDMIYNTKTKEISLLNGYYYKSSKYESKGKEFFLNNETGIGYVVSGYVKDFIDNQYASGDRVDFNRNLKNYYIKGNGYFKTPKYTLKSQEVDYRGTDGFAYLPLPYEFLQNGKNDFFKGNSAEYNLKSFEFKTPGEFVYESGDNILKGENLLYNTETEVGNIEKNVSILSKKDNTLVTGDKGEFKKEDYANIIGNLVIENSKADFFATDGKYKLKEEKIYIPGEITIKGKENPMDGNMFDGVYNIKTNKFSAKNFHGKDVNNTLKSDIINYYVNEDRVELQGSAKITKDTTVLTGQLLDYKLKTEVANSPKPFQIEYGTFIINGTKGMANLANENLDIDDIRAKSKDGDNFSANKGIGNMTEMKMDFVGNAKGTVYQNGVPIKFDGKLARVYFKKEGSGYKAQRAEIKDDAVITKEDMTLYSKYLEMDIPRDLVFGREDTRIKIKNENGVTDITSRVMDANIKTEVANLIGDVVIVNKDNKGKITRTTSDKAIVKNKDSIVELIGKVFTENEESTVEADKAIYNMKTNKLKAIGNVFVEYKTK